MDATEVIGKRILITGSKWGDKSAEEVKVLEISPSKQWIKLQNMNGMKFWKPTHEVGVLEVLKSLEVAPEIK